MISPVTVSREQLSSSFAKSRRAACPEYPASGRRVAYTCRADAHRAGWRDRPRSCGRPNFHIKENNMTSHDAARSLAGKVALVTGAGRGLGRAFAERLASLGADVAIHGMREHGPAEYGEGSTLTAVAEAVAVA